MNVDSLGDPFNDGSHRLGRFNGELDGPTRARFHAATAPTALLAYNRLVPHYVDRIHETIPARAGPATRAAALIHGN